ncbi:GTPase, IMAP family member 1, isoform CRA_c [Rattus norvegicus]|uniref:GTPase, IMAP family member 1, isoform CRA_c n=1 Tax=Rattus norvegicus TaxID=10116 RepID=A6K0H6_RAT|nr:GTPase, IMAP family member 1, isoform CRA_c [Rattus norvegicus]
MLSPRQKETSARTSEGKAGGWGLFWATSETFSKKGMPLFLHVYTEGFNKQRLSNSGCGLSL